MIAVVSSLRSNYQLGVLSDDAAGTDFSAITPFTVAEWLLPFSIGIIPPAGDARRRVRARDLSVLLGIITSSPMGSVWLRTAPWASAAPSLASRRCIGRPTQALRRGS